VKATIEHLLENMDEEATIEGERSMTFSIRMRESDHDMLTFLADHFRMKKTPFADMLLRDAMHETIQTIARRRSGGDQEKAQAVFRELLDEASGRKAAS
jgi:hypothetical protein